MRQEAERKRLAESVDLVEEKMHQEAERKVRQRATLEAKAKARKQAKLEADARAREQARLEADARAREQARLEADAKLRTEETKRRGWDRAEAEAINLDDTLRTDTSAAAAPVEGGPKDDHWYDVQTKFDLAKAYQEMGDHEGAREILQEVTKEGDAGQQAEAKKLLDSLL